MDQRLSYTAIGDVVNVASRLEALGKAYETEVIIGEATRMQCKSAIVVRSLGMSAVRGRAESLEIYELLSIANDTVGDAAENPVSFEDAEVQLGNRPIAV